MKQTSEDNKHSEEWILCLAPNGKPNQQVLCDMAVHRLDYLHSPCYRYPVGVNGRERMSGGVSDSDNKWLILDIWFPSPLSICYYVHNIMLLVGK